MSNGGAFVFNNEVNGNGANIAQGQTVSQEIHQTFGDAPPSVEQVFDAIEKALPPEAARDIGETVVEPLKLLACMPLAELETEEVKKQAEPLYARLIPYVPQISKGLATFGKAALKALASRNPIVAGVLALCEMNAEGGSQTA